MYGNAHLIQKRTGKRVKKKLAYNACHVIYTGIAELLQRTQCVALVDISISQAPKPRPDLHLCHGHDKYKDHIASARPHTYEFCKRAARPCQVRI